MDDCLVIVGVVALVRTAVPTLPKDDEHIFSRFVSQSIVSPSLSLSRRLDLDVYPSFSSFFLPFSPLKTKGRERARNNSSEEEPRGNARKRDNQQSLPVIKYIKFILSLSIYLFRSDKFTRSSSVLDRSFLRWVEETEREEEKTADNEPNAEVEGEKPLISLSTTASSLSRWVINERMRSSRPW